MVRFVLASATDYDIMGKFVASQKVLFIHGVGLMSLFTSLEIFIKNCVSCRQNMDLFKSDFATVR